MAIRVTIADDKLSNFSKEAQQTLKQQVEMYSAEVIKEANLLEEGFREDNASQEITSSYVVQAARKYRISRPEKKNKSLLWVKFASYISVLLVGGLFDLASLQKSLWHLVGFIVVFAIATITTLLQFIGEEGR